MAWSMTGSIEVGPDRAGKHDLIGHRRITLDDVQRLCGIAALAFSTAFTREVEVYGWDRREWDAYARHALADLR